MMLPVITFLSDYGPGDEYVGVVHGVIASIAPDARVLDLGHGVPPQDVRTGARRLARALPFVPAGVHLAVVDPGVGGTRRALALRIAGGERAVGRPGKGALVPGPGALRRRGRGGRDLAVPGAARAGLGHVPRPRHL